MPYTDRNGQTRYTDREQYWHNKKIADAGKTTAHTLHDGTVMPARTLTRTEIVRYANKAESARLRLNKFMREQDQTAAPTPVVTAKPKTTIAKNKSKSKKSA